MRASASFVRSGDVHRLLCLSHSLEIFTVEECHEAAFTTAALCSRSLESLALASGLKMGGLTQTSF